MTKEDAIKKMKSMKQTFIDLHTPQQMKKKESKRVIEAYDMAIKALSAEPCEDTISRKWLKNAIHNFYKGLVHTPTEEDIQAYIDVAPSVKPQYTEAEIQRIQELEQAQLEKAYELGKAEQTKMGHWIDEPYYKIGEYGEEDTYYTRKCSECFEKYDVVFNYCPNCGAKMEVEE